MLCSDFQVWSFLMLSHSYNAFLVILKPWYGYSDTANLGKLTLCLKGSWNTEHNISNGAHCFFNGNESFSYAVTYVSLVALEIHMETSGHNTICSLPVGVMESCHSEGAKLELIQFVTVTIRTLIKKDSPLLMCIVWCELKQTSRLYCECCWVYWLKIRLCNIPAWLFSKQLWLLMLMSRCDLNVSGIQTIQNALCFLVCLRRESSTNKKKQL